MHCACQDATSRTHATHNACGQKSAPSTLGNLVCVLNLGIHLLGGVGRVRSRPATHTPPPRRALGLALLGAPKGWCFSALAFACLLGVLAFTLLKKLGQGQFLMFVLCEMCRSIVAHHHGVSRVASFALCSFLCCIACLLLLIEKWRSTKITQ